MNRLVIGLVATSGLVTVVASFYNSFIFKSRIGTRVEVVALVTMLGLSLVSWCLSVCVLRWEAAAAVVVVPQVAPPPSETKTKTKEAEQVPPV